MSLRGRLARLERGRPKYSQEDCPLQQVGLIVDADDPEPDPADVAPCPHCGHGHVLVIIEEIVDPPEGHP
jgi:hypothetical protein